MRANSLVRRRRRLRVSELLRLETHTRTSCLKSEANATEKAEEPEPETKDRTTTVWKLTEGLANKSVRRLWFQTGREQQKLDKDLWRYLLLVRRFWRRSLCLVRLQCLISSSHLHGLLHRHVYCSTLELMIQMTLRHFTSKCLALKLSFRISCNFSYVWTFFFVELDYLAPFTPF